MILADGVPCDHRGCLHHLTHPCEGCGRIGGINNLIAKKHLTEDVKCVTLKHRLKLDVLSEPQNFHGGNV